MVPGRWAERRGGRTVRPRAGSVVNRCGGGWSAVADAPSAPARAGDPPEVGEECRRSANENATASRNRRPRPAPLFEAVTAGLSIDVAELKRARPHSVRPATFGRVYGTAL